MGEEEQNTLNWMTLDSDGFNTKFNVKKTLQRIYDYICEEAKWRQDFVIIYTPVISVQQGRRGEKGNSPQSPWFAWFLSERM